MNKLNSKNWQRIRINRASKVLTFSNAKTYRTKADCEIDINTNQYIAINLKALNVLLSQGYTINQDSNKSVLKTHTVAKTLSNEQIDLTGNPEVEEAIRKYYIKKKSKEEANKRAIEQFLQPVPQPKVQPFDLSKRHEQFEKTGRKRAITALENQRNDYCNMEG